MKKFSIFFLIIVFLSLKLYPESSCRIILESDSLLPFRDINDVQSICFYHKNIMSFISYKGEKSFNINTNTWKIYVDELPFRCTKDKYETSPYNCNIGFNDSFPDWYERGVYCHIVAKKTSRKGNVYILSKIADGGAAYCIEDIIDIKKEKVYRITFQDTRFMEIIEPYIWLGSKSGITRIDIETNKRVDFYALPKFSAISGWVDYKGIRYITTEEGYLMYMDIDKGTIDLIDIPKDILQEGGVSDDKPSTYPRIANFTSPIIHKNKLYVGFYSTFYNRHAWPQSIIVLYNITEKEWSYIKLSNNISGIQKLIVKGDMILCLGSLTEGYEGGDYGEFGGLSIIKEEKEIISYKEFANLPIELFEINQDTLSIIIGKYSRVKGQINHFYYQISLSNFKIIDSLEIGENSTVYNSFGEDVFSEKYEEKAILDKWLVKPKLIEVDKALEIIDFSKKDSL